jgi:hypothetical protein
MKEWIVVGVLYALGMTFFHLVGGLDAAAEAFRRWGAASAARRARQRSSS